MQSPGNETHSDIDILWRD